jgi:hypothetical protein
MLISEEEINMPTILPEGEKIRQAVKWISDERLEDENKPLSMLIGQACRKFNLSPKDEEYLNGFYGNSPK